MPQLLRTAPRLFEKRDMLALFRGGSVDVPDINQKVILF